MERGRPNLSVFHILNMCVGFMGIQFGFALQSANVSRIFQTLGADYSNMTLLWVAAPITGLIVQPIVGYFSDRTWWGWLGRRRPYFLIGAVCASLALFVMPNSPTLWIAAGMLWIMDASINLSMEPMRAFVGDMLPRTQRSLGYACQSLFIGIGAVVASALPWLMANWFGVANTAAPGTVPDSVKVAFYCGGAIFFLAVLWTVLSVREYPPAQLRAFAAADGEEVDPAPNAGQRPARTYFTIGGVSLVLGLAASALIHRFIEHLDKNLFLLGGLGIFFGLLMLLAGGLQQCNRRDNGLLIVMADLLNMPTQMRKLAVVQFFSWFPFFCLWTSATIAITAHHYGTSDPSSEIYNQGADWVGVLFSVYNLAAVAAACALPVLVRLLKTHRAHGLNLALGGLAFLSFLFIRDPAWLVAPMLAIGIAWASILALPYALLANALPYDKMGLYMGIFNFFIVLPQILAASILGFLISTFFGGQTIYAFIIAGLSMLLAATLSLRLPEQT
ncbi:MAG: MFS transporter [Cellvibrionales bacterium]|nr:MFS transporter [Cellvibrionales bacterium]